MRNALACAVLLCALTVSSAQAADGWQVSGSLDSPPYRLSLGLEGAVTYVFDCAGDSVEIKQTAVTQLTDVSSGQAVGDGPDASMPEKTSVMGLFTDKSEVKLVPATSAHNAAGGWDLTISISKNDKAFTSMAKAGLISLMTTGFTTAVKISASDRKLIGAFVDRCRGK